MQAENQLNDEHLETVSGGSGDRPRITPGQVKRIAQNYLKEEDFYIGRVILWDIYYEAQVHDSEGNFRYSLRIDANSGEII